MTRSKKLIQAQSPASKEPPSGVATQPVSRRQMLLGAAALVAMVLATYVQAFGGGFLPDDAINLSSNRTMYSFDGLRQMWFVPGSVQQYYPLVHTMFWVESRLWGFDPHGYHVVNVLLHAANAVLVWRLLLVLRVPGAWLAAAVFALHPVEVESVAWIIERKNVLSMALALLSMLCYLRFDPAEGPVGGAAAAGHWRWYWLSVLLFAAAMFAKTVVVTMPAVLLVIYWWKRGRISGGDVAPLLPLFASGIALALITVWQEQNLGADGQEWSLTFVERMLVAGRALWFYAGKIFWPHPLAFYYPRWNVDASAWWQYLFPAAAVAVIVVLWWLRGRIGRGPLAAVLIFAGMLAPALGFFKIYFQLFSFVADHFQYHASVALVALAVASCATVWSRQAWRLPNAAALRVLGAAGLLAILAVMSLRALSVFHDEETLYRDAIEKNPESWIAFSHLSVRLGVLGRYDEALEASRHAMRLAPNRPRIPYNEGRILLDRGERDGFEASDLDQAIASFKLASRLNPGWAPAYVELGRALIHAKRFDEARRYLDRALELAPDNVGALCRRGLLSTEAGKWADAQARYEKALKIQPGLADAHFGLGQALTGSGQLKLAEKQFAEAVRLKPEYPEAWNNLGITLARLGEMNRAVECFRQALHYDPDSLQAQTNLSKALRSLPARAAE
jgi:tetratricopeptide (TPR) repeat protein